MYSRDDEMFEAESELREACAEDADVLFSFSFIVRSSVSASLSLSAGGSIRVSDCLVVRRGFGLPSMDLR